MRAARLSALTLFYALAFVSAELTDLKAYSKIASADEKITGDAVFTWDDVWGVQWDIKMKGMTNMKEGGYAWHIHQFPSEKGDCSDIGAHLNPTGVKGNEDHEKPWLFEVGDLASKKGGIPGTESGETTEVDGDGYLRFWPCDFSILGRSIAIHDPDTGKPYACGSIVSPVDGTSDEAGKAIADAKSSYQSYPDREYTDMPADAEALGAPSVQDMPDIMLKIDESGKRNIEKAEPFKWEAGTTLPECGASHGNSTEGAAGGAAAGNEKAEDDAKETDQEDDSEPSGFNSLDVASPSGASSGAAGGEDDEAEEDDSSDSSPSGQASGSAAMSGSGSSPSDAEETGMGADDAAESASPSDFDSSAQGFEASIKSLLLGCSIASFAAAFV